jgi:hypothetical protein
MTKKNWSLFIGPVSIGILLFAAAAFGQSGPPGSAQEGRAATDGKYLDANPAAQAATKIPYYDDGIPAPIGYTDEDGFSALGDNPIVSRSYSDKAPKPSADPRNFEGAWAHRDLARERIFRNIFETRLPYNDEGRKIMKHRREMENSGKPPLTNAGRCYPTVEFALEINGPFFIVQSEKFIHVTFHEFHHHWQIRMNQKHKTTGPREFAGDSIGHWDGNTLVVETTRYKEPIWLDPVGTPASEDAVLTRRIRKIENGQALEMITTVDDPKYYTKPWSFARPYGWSPDGWRVGEYNCEQQVGGPNGAGYGQVKEQPLP